MRKLKPGSPFLPRLSNDGIPAVPQQGRRARAQKSPGLKWSLAPRGGNLRRTRLLLASGGEFNLGAVRDPERYLHTSRTQR